MLVLSWAYKNAHVNVVVYLFTKFPTLQHDHSTITDMLQNACKNEHLEVVKYLYKNITLDEVKHFLACKFISESTKIDVSIKCVLLQKRDAYKTKLTTAHWKKVDTLTKMLVFFENSRIFKKCVFF